MPRLISCISIHAPREGGDRPTRRASARVWHFNPRPPRGGRPYVLYDPRLATRISIHAPREGGDPGRTGGITCRAIKFQSTPPARGATPAPAYVVQSKKDFNPRPPRGGRPREICRRRRPAAYFNPRPPRGGRPREICRRRRPAAYFNPRPPRGGRLFCQVLLDF